MTPCCLTRDEWARNIQAIKCFGDGGFWGEASQGKTQNFLHPPLPISVCWPVTSHGQKWRRVKMNGTNQCEKVKYCTGSTDKSFYPTSRHFSKCSTGHKLRLLHTVWASGKQIQILQSLTKILTSLDLATIPRSKHRYKSLSIRGQLETNTSKA